MIDLKYVLMRGGWCTKVAQGAYGVSLWKYMQREWEKFSLYIKYEVGDGTSIKSWLDIRCGETTLKESFPDLCRLA